MCVCVCVYACVFVSVSVCVCVCVRSRPSILLNVHTHKKSQAKESGHNYIKRATPGEKQGITQKRCELSIEVVVLRGRW